MTMSAGPELTGAFPDVERDDSNEKSKKLEETTEEDIQSADITSSHLGALNSLKSALRKVMITAFSEPICASSCGLDAS